MAEKLNLPKITKEDISGIEQTNQEPITGALSTAPVSEVPETPVVEPTIEQVPEPIIEEPAVEPEPTIVTPEVTVEPTVKEVKVEEKAPTVTESPKQADTKVETVQDIKAKETTNEAQENELNEVKKNQVVTEMQQMIQNGSTLEEIQKFGVKNPQFRDDINTVLR